MAHPTICDSADQRERRRGVAIFILAGPNKNFVCFPVNLTHQSDLVSSLLDIFLVDTYCIRPNESGTVGKAHSFKCLPQVARDTDGVAIANDLDPFLRSPPNVRESLIFWRYMVNVAKLQTTEDPVLISSWLYHQNPNPVSAWQLSVEFTSAPRQSLLLD